MLKIEALTLLLGVFDEATFDDETVQLDRGDTLVVFSDGVTDALDAGGSEFGEERLLSCVAASRGLAPAFLLAISVWRGTASTAPVCGLLHREWEPPVGARNLRAKRDVPLAVPFDHSREFVVHGRFLRSTIPPVKARCHALHQTAAAGVLGGRW